MENSALAHLIANSKRIPTLTTQVRFLFQAFSDDTLGLSDLAKILKDYPIISARLIGLANSAWFAPAMPINSIERACASLGMDIVRSVSIGLALISPFNVLSCPAFKINRFWVSSKLVADGSVLLASKLSSPLAHDSLQTLYTCGLLHNFGLLFLADAKPEETQQVLKSHENNPELDLNTALYQYFGADFCKIGAWIAEHWGLPDDLVAVIKYHREMNYQGDHWQKSALVGSAAAIVSALSHDSQTMPDLPILEKLSISIVDQQQVFDKLQVMLPKLSEMAKTIFQIID